MPDPSAENLEEICGSLEAMEFYSDERKRTEYRRLQLQQQQRVAPSPRPHTTSGQAKRMEAQKRSDEALKKEIAAKYFNGKPPESFFKNKAATVNPPLGSNDNVAPEEIFEFGAVSFDTYFLNIFFFQDFI